LSARRSGHRWPQHTRRAAAVTASAQVVRRSATGRSPAERRAVPSVIGAIPSVGVAFFDFCSSRSRTYSMQRRPVELARREASSSAACPNRQPGCKLRRCDAFGTSCRARIGTTSAAPSARRGRRRSAGPAPAVRRRPAGGVETGCWGLQGRHLDERTAKPSAGIAGVGDRKETPARCARRPSRHPGSQTSGRRHLGQPAQSVPAAAPVADVGMGDQTAQQVDDIA